MSVLSVTTGGSCQATGRRNLRPTVSASANVPRRASVGPWESGRTLSTWSADTCGGERRHRVECPRYDQMTGDRSWGGCGVDARGLLCGARAGSSRQAEEQALRTHPHMVRLGGRFLISGEAAGVSRPPSELPPTSGTLLGRLARFLVPLRLVPPTVAAARVPMLRATLPRRQHGGERWPSRSHPTT